MLVVFRYKSAAAAYFYRIIGHFPGFFYTIDRDIVSARKYKKLGGLKKYNIGQATHKKVARLFFLNVMLFKVDVNEGEELTAEHFFLSRSVLDLKMLLKFCCPLALNKSSVVFDPACGTGKHLQYVVDTFQCKGIGFDVYQPAINVANVANIGNSVNFFCESSLDLDILNENLPKNVDLVFINSWLGYVLNDENFSQFITYITNKSKYIMVISSLDDNLHSIFKNSKKVIDVKKAGTHYALYQNNL